MFHILVMPLYINRVIHPDPGPPFGVRKTGWILAAGVAIYSVEMGCDGLHWTASVEPVVGGYTAAPELVSIR